MAGRQMCRPVSIPRPAAQLTPRHPLIPMIRHLMRPNIASVMTHWPRPGAMILALYFGLSAVYGNGSRQETFAAHAYAGLTVLRARTPSIGAWHRRVQDGKTGD